MSGLNRADPVIVVSGACSGWTGHLKYQNRRQNYADLCLMVAGQACMATFQTDAETRRQVSNLWWKHKRAGTADLMLDYPVPDADTGLLSNR